MMHHPHRYTYFYNPTNSEVQPLKNNQSSILNKIHSMTFTEVYSIIHSQHLNRSLTLMLYVYSLGKV